MVTMKFVMSKTMAEIMRKFDELHGKGEALKMLLEYEKEQEDVHAD